MNQTKSKIILIWSGKKTKKLSRKKYQKTKKVRTKYQQIIWYFVRWYFVLPPDTHIFFFEQPSNNQSNIDYFAFLWEENIERKKLKNFCTCFWSISSCDLKPTSGFGLPIFPSAWNNKLYCIVLVSPEFIISNSDQTPFLVDISISRLWNVEGRPSTIHSSQLSHHNKCKMFA